MKILHTADWHLNERLGRVHLQTNIAARLREIVHYLDEHNVDVMLVAGDLFSRYMRYDELESAFKDAHEIFKPFLLRGGTILALSGNHDTEAVFSILRMAVDLASPIDPAQSGPRPRGRLYLAPSPAVITLEDKRGLPVQFVLMPYPRRENYLDGQTRIDSTDEENRLLQQKFAEYLRSIQANRQAFDPTRHSVLMTHIYVRGVEVNPESGRELSEAEEIPFNLSDIPTGWAYVACGHIHQAQPIGTIAHVRYAGSIERLDAGERNDEKSVVLFEIGPTGLIGEPQLLPLDATPIYQVEITDPDTQLTDLEARYPDHDRALVSYRVIHTPGGTHTLDQLFSRLGEVFPNWYQRRVDNGVSPLAPADATSERTLKDVHGTVIHYLESRLKDHADRDEILALAGELLVNSNWNQGGAQ